MLAIFICIFVRMRTIKSIFRFIIVWFCLANGYDYYAMGLGIIPKTNDPYK